MLVLSRKIGEVITVGSSVKVTVLSYDRGVVRLGIEAPKSIPVHRKEVHDKIVEMNKKAAKTKLQAFKDAISNTSVVFDQSRISKVTKREFDKSTFVMSDKTITDVTEESSLSKDITANNIDESKFESVIEIKLDEFELNSSSNSNNIIKQKNSSSVKLNKKKTKK